MNIQFTIINLCSENLLVYNIILQPTIINIIQFKYIFK